MGWLWLMSMVESDSAVREVSQEIPGARLETLHFDMVLSLPQVKKGRCEA